MNDQISKLQELATTELGMDDKQTKPLVMLPGNGVQIRDTAKAIYEVAAAQKALFYHKRTVAKLERPDGNSATLAILSSATARSEFEKFVRFGRKTKDDIRGDVLTESDAKAILASDVAADILPNVTGVLRRPIPVLHAGKVEILRKGYNPETGFLVEDGVIEEPATLQEAVDLIESALVGSKFQTDSDKARAIASIITPALKMGGFIKGNTPIDVAEANESQTGKTYFLRLRCLIYGEEPLVLAEQKGGVGSTDEKIAGALLQGCPFVILDNFRGNLNSQLLESYTTNRARLGVRVPHAGIQLVDGSNLSIAISSNGMTMTEDLANRISFIRLEKEADRVFPLINGMDISEVIESLQKYYIGAITKIIRHYHEQGMPKTSERRHDFREWAQSLDWIVQNIFGLPALIEGNREAQQRVHNPALGFVRLLTIQIEKAGRLGEHFRAREIADFCEGCGLEIPGVNQEAIANGNEMHEPQKIGKLMAEAFGKSNELALDQFQISREKASKVNASGNLTTGPRYTFNRKGSEAGPATNGGDESDIMTESARDSAKETKQTKEGLS